MTAGKNSSLQAEARAETAFMQNPLRIWNEMALQATLSAAGTFRMSWAAAKDSIKVCIEWEAAWWWKASGFALDVWRMNPET
jgi:phage-related minor tail protein